MKGRHLQPAGCTPSSRRHHRSSIPSHPIKVLPVRLPTYPTCLTILAFNVRPHTHSQTLAVCQACLGFGVSTLAYLYDAGETDGVVSATVESLPGLPGACMVVQKGPSGAETGYQVTVRAV